MFNSMYNSVCVCVCIYIYVYVCERVYIYDSTSNLDHYNSNTYIALKFILQLHV